MKEKPIRPCHIASNADTRYTLCGIKKYSEEALPYIGYAFWQDRIPIEGFCPACIEKAKEA